MASLFIPLLCAAVGLVGAQERPPDLPPRDVATESRPIVPGIDPGRPVPSGPVTPDPGFLGLSGIWARPDIGWRDMHLSPAPGEGSISAPYPGLAIGALWELPDPGWGLHWGLSAAYGYAPLRLESPGQSAQSASEHRFRGELQVSLPPSELGRVGLQLGAAYEGFLAPDNAALPTVRHFSPRFGLTWSRPVVGPVALRLEGGVRPWATAGNAATSVWGPLGSSNGYDVTVGLSGPVGTAGLGWSVGYTWLRYDSRFDGAAAGPRELTEAVHRFGVGISWSPPGPAADNARP